MFFLIFNFVMREIDFNLLSNAELKIKMNEMENEYESLKNKINTILNRMEELDNKYDKLKTILNKRTRGKAL